MSSDSEINKGEYLEKAGELLNMFAQENEKLKEDVFGYKYVAEEEQKHNVELSQHINALEKERHELKQRLHGYTNKISKTDKCFENVLKNYGKELTDAKKQEIKQRFSKYLSKNKTSK